MGSAPPELSLDLKPSFVPKSISALLKEVSVIGDFSVKATKLDDFVKRLEDEMRKIDAFKRELPLCMLLLQDGSFQFCLIEFFLLFSGEINQLLDFGYGFSDIDGFGCWVLDEFDFWSWILLSRDFDQSILALKGELLQFEPKPQPVLEKFIPLKDSDSENGEIEKEKECSIKKHWMSTFQLYDYQSIDSPKHDETKRNEEMSHKTTTVEAFQIENHKKGIGGDKSFWHYSDFPGVRKEEREELPVPALSLLTPGMRIMKQELGFVASKASCSRAVSSPSASFAASVHVGQQQSRPGRKQRRCWSPELHRRFVQALQELGGSQVATPKQIRELMNVNGLTNDEVKSHLQKYRLHTRRTSHASSGTPANQSVVLGGLWMSQHHRGEPSKANGSQSGSPQGPFQSGAPGSNDDDDSDDDDDEDEGEHEKAESFSWKGHIPKPIKSDA